MLSAQAIADLVGARADDPFALLGMHDRDGRLWVAAILPGAQAVEVLSRAGATLAKLACVHPDGLFDGPLAQGAARGDYRLRVHWAGRHNAADQRCKHDVARLVVQSSHEGCGR